MSTLVIYFSKTGTTRATAEKIAEIKKADMVEIKPERPYEMSYGKPVLTSMKEILTKARPALAMELPDVQKYDRILIGVVRSCAKCSPDAVGCPGSKRETCCCIYYKRIDKAVEACC